MSIGYYPVAPYGSVTLRTWGNIQQHKGIWYKLKGYFKTSNRVSVSMELFASNVDEMNRVIRNSNRWSILNNCSIFASRVWNSFSVTQVSAGGINSPSNLANSIKSLYKDSYKENISIPSKSTSDFYYQSSDSIVSVPNPIGGGSSSSILSTNQIIDINKKGTSNETIPYINSFYDINFEEIINNRKDKR